MMALKAVLFDLGGTLLHYHDPHETDRQRPFRRVTMLGVQAVLAKVAASGWSLPAPDQIQEIIDRHIGLAYRALVETQAGGTVETPVRAGLAEMGVNLDDAQWADLRPDFYSHINQIVFPRSGIVETLIALRSKGCLLGLISNTYWAADVHDAHIEAYGLSELLPMRLYSCDLPHSKPHPAIFQAALERLGVSAGESAYVGDRPDVDVAGAQNAGMRGILIRSPYDSASLDGIAPDHIIDEIPGLLDFIVSL